MLRNHQNHQLAADSIRLGRWKWKKCGYNLGDVVFLELFSNGIFTPLYRASKESPVSWGRVGQLQDQERKNLSTNAQPKKTKKCEWNRPEISVMDEKCIGTNPECAWIYWFGRDRVKTGEERAGDFAELHSGLLRHLAA
jgi:hypothetical protein